MSTQNYGTVQHNDITLTLTQQAYLQSNGNDNWYQALANDIEGNEYMVYWDCLPGWMDMEDESDCCDWTVYTVKTL